MANVTVGPGGGGATVAKTVATLTDGSSAEHQQVVCEYVVAGTPTQVSAATPFPVNIISGGGSGGTASSYGAAFPATGTAAGFSDGTNMQSGRVFDADTGAGTEYTVGVVLRSPASGGSVAFGTSAAPIRVDPTGTTIQPISAASLPLPSGAATDRTTAGGPGSVQLSDGTAFYVAAKTGQFPAALVSGRFDVNIGASSATVPVSAASLPLPTGAATDRTTAAAPGAVRLTDGTAFYDAAKTGQLPAALVSGRLDMNLGASSATVTVDSELPAAAAAADAAGNPTAPTVVAALSGFNGTTWDRLRSTTANGLVVDVSRVGGTVTVSGTVTANAGTGTLSVDTELPAAAALADGAGNPTAPATGAFAMGWNGTTWDRLKSSTGNGLQVDVTRVPKASTATAPAQTTQSTTAASVLAANTARKQAMIQNTGTTVIRLALGGTPTQTAYHVALRACAAADDGTGGTFVTDTWTGAISAISSAAGGTLVVTELT